jgi:hypothetical protein
VQRQAACSDSGLSVFRSSSGTSGDLHPEKENGQPCRGSSPYPERDVPMKVGERVAEHLVGELDRLEDRFPELFPISGARAKTPEPPRWRARSARRHDCRATPRWRVHVGCCFDAGKRRCDLSGEKADAVLRLSRPAFLTHRTTAGVGGLGPWRRLGALVPRRARLPPPELGEVGTRSAWRPPSPRSVVVLSAELFAGDVVASSRTTHLQAVNES